MLHAVRTLIAPLPEAWLQSFAGLLLWAAAVLLLQPGWSAALLIFGPLVIYPLLFDLLGSDRVQARRLSLVAFLPALASYAFNQGTLAGALALPWFVFTGGLFLSRLMAEAREKQYVLLLIKSYLIVGAGWLVLARLGQRPLDFSHAIVHATAVHFHYAGFVLPILALQWVKVEPTTRRYILLGALLLGVPLVAAGITLSALGIHGFELGAVCFFVAACAWFAVEQIRLAFASRLRWRRSLLLTSSLSLLLAMSLAFGYATASFWQIDWLDIPFMLRTHGPIQVFGFALPGTIAWARIKAKGSD
jgi:hypothetical protein